MKAIGAPPKALVLLDDTILDAQCCADAQGLNTAHMLERFKEVFADGFVDERDEEAVLDLYRHTRLEDRFNSDQCSLMKWARVHTSGTVGLVVGLRAKVQQSKRAALASGPAKT